MKRCILKVAHIWRENVKKTAMAFGLVLLLTMGIVFLPKMFSKTSLNLSGEAQSTASVASTKANLSQSVPEQNQDDSDSALPQFGTWRVLGAGNSKGYYLLEQIADTWFSEIFYIDYEAAEKKPLCQTENCLHQDETCSAYIDYGEAEYVFATEDSLFWVNRSYMNAPETGEVFASIATSKLSGEQHKTIAQFEKEQHILGNIFYDGKHIAFSFTQASPQTKQIERRIMILEITSGETVANYLLESDAVPSIVGITKDSILLMQSPSTLPYGTPETLHKLSLLGLANGKMQELESINFQQEKWIYNRHTWHNGQLYAVDKTGNIVQIDLPSYSPKILFEAPENWQDVSFEIFDEHFIIESIVEEKWEHYFVPIEGGEATKLSLSRNLEGEILPLWVWAESPAAFLVNYGAKIVPTVLTGTGGDKYTIQQRQIIFGLISKEDYYNNIANYKEILNGTTPW